MLVYKVCLFFATFAYAIAVVLYCDFRIIKEYYTCVPKQDDFSKRTTKVDFYNGTHKTNMTDSDVRAFISYGVNFSYIPMQDGGSFNNRFEVFKMIDACLLEIDPKVLRLFQNIEEFSFRDNLISSLEKDTFAGSSKLLRLDLSNNRIKELPDGLFLTQTNLAEFYADNNQIEILEENIFLKSEKIMRISMKDNKLRRIKCDFEVNWKVDQIYFDNNTCTNQTFFIQTIKKSEFQRLLRTTCFDKIVTTTTERIFDWGEK